jgi:Diacylglycerol kinase catalytic domain
MMACAPIGAPLFLVVNSSARGSSDALLQQVSAALHRADCQFKILRSRGSVELPRQARHAARLAQRYRGTLVAAGSDLTIDAVAREALRVGRPFGVLPLGAATQFARAHDLPTDPERAVAVLLAGHWEPVQIAQVSGPTVPNHAHRGRPAPALEPLLTWRGVRRLLAAAARSVGVFWTPKPVVGQNEPPPQRRAVVGAPHPSRALSLGFTPRALRLIKPRRTVEAV